MMRRDLLGIPKSAEVGAPPTYEAPKIETVLTPEDLEREVHYAGALGSSRGCSSSDHPGDSCRSGIFGIRMASSSPSSCRYVQSPQVESSRAGDRVVLFHQGSRTALVLNPTASWLWGLLGEPHPQEDLVVAIQSRFIDVPPAAAAGDVSTLVQQLVEHGMLVIEV
jgi:hypothetical protein